MKRILLISLISMFSNVANSQGFEKAFIDSSIKDIYKKDSTAGHILTRHLRRLESDTCSECKEMNALFLDSLIVCVANIRVKTIDKFEEYLNKSDLGILDSPPSLEGQNLTKYKIYSGLSYLNFLKKGTENMTTPAIYEYIDTIKVLAKFINDDSTVKFTKFSEKDKEYINGLITECYSLYKEYLEAKKFSYETKTQAEKTKLKTQNKNRPRVYSYFLFLDTLYQKNNLPVKKS